MTNERLEQIKQIRAYGLQAEPTALLLAIDDLLAGAVSVPPQPSVDIKQKCINFICQNPYPAWAQLVELVESCFAAAPAQEPTISDRMQGVDCPLCESGEPHKHVAPKAAKVKRIKELLAEWDALAKEVAQEQPVENNPQKACEVCGATEMLTVMGKNKYACPKHRAASTAEPTER